jgi:hypothetical protein
LINETQEERKMGNFSRDTFKFNQLKRYVGVRMQQGVPILDADWNEQDDIRKHELRAFLKWFVGSGVPAGNDGFRIMPHPEGKENDFIIKGGNGTADQPGRCLVDGWDVIINEDVDYTKQELFGNNDLAIQWDVDPLETLSPPTQEQRIDTVYLDVWEREVDADEDNDLINTAIGIETCVRIKREWVVRVAQGQTELPAPPQDHVFFQLAQLNRAMGNNLITQQDITDSRQVCLSQDSVKEYVDAKTAEVREGALSTGGGFAAGPIQIKTQEWSGLTASATKTYGVMGRLTNDPDAGSDFRCAGVVGVSEIEGTHGVFAKAPENDHALYVQGTAYFSGGKGGYVVDVFKNAAKESLHTGDVVKLKGTSVCRFLGDNNKIPVSEVTLADKESDNCTIGIVDRRAISEEMDAGQKSGAEAGDPAVIEEGEELYVVTLGTYFHCKVDASDAPINVGDLLTSSANPGHAQKAADPKIGSIIGKALEPLEKDTGYIAVFVNIQ